MKALSLIIWLSWAAIITRVLLAPTIGLSLNQALALLLVAAPAVGILCWLRWLFRTTGSSAPRETRSAAQGMDAVDGVGEWPGIVGQVF